MGVGWSVTFSASCPHVADGGYQCMVCDTPATGHARVDGGPHDGRCIAILCPCHASEDGWEEFKDALVSWSQHGQFAIDGGPGMLGAPEVWHGDHWDPMPEHAEVPGGH